MGRFEKPPGGPFAPRNPRANARPLAVGRGISAIPYDAPVLGGGGGPLPAHSPWQILAGYLCYPYGGVVVGQPSGANMGMGTINAQEVYANGVKLDMGGFLPITGGSMSGYLLLNAPPTDPLGAVPKNYVDSAISAGASLYLPLLGGTLTGPLTFEEASGTARVIFGTAATAKRWGLNLGNATVEIPFAGTNWNTGSDFTLDSYNDDGTFARTALSISRLTGFPTFSAGKLYVGPTSGSTVPAGLYLYSDSSHSSHIYAYKNDKARWLLTLAGTETETGVANAGADFSLTRQKDDGTTLDTVLTIPRTSGKLTLTYMPSFPGGTLGQVLTTNGSGALSWTTITGTFVDAPNDGQYYSRRNLSWTVSPGGLTDAPNDGAFYGRKGMVWIRPASTDLYDLATAFAPYALLAGPAFTGVPTAPTAAASDNSTQIATTAFVNAKLTGAYLPLTGGTLTGQLKTVVADGALGLLVTGPTKGIRFVTSTTGSSIEGVDQTGVGSFQPLSLNGTALNLNAPVTVAANKAFTLGQDPALALQAATKQYVDNKAGNIVPVVDGAGAPGLAVTFSRSDHVHPIDMSRAPVNSPTFTGTVVIPTGATIVGFAPLASPNFTGTPALPGATTGVTRPIGTNDTTLATTAFVIANGGSGGPSGAFLPLTGGVLSGDLVIDGTAGTRRYVRGTTDGKTRWEMCYGDEVVETGTAAGSNFVIYNYDNAGTVIGPALTIDRASGSTVYRGWVDQVGYSHGGIAVNFTASDITKDTDFGNGFIIYNEGQYPHHIISAAYSTVAPNTLTFRRSRGTYAAPALPLVNDVMGQITFNAWLGPAAGTFGGQVRLEARVLEPTPSATAMGSGMYTVACPLGKAAGQFISLQKYGELDLITATAAPSNQILALQKSGSGYANIIQGHTGPITASTLRWGVFLGDITAESSGNVGSNFAISRYSDTGVLIDTPFTINRSTGVATFSVIPSLPGGAPGYVLSTNSTGVLTWVAQPVVPLASSTLPLINNVASAVGVSSTWARADHVHPTDTSRYAAVNPADYQSGAQVAALYLPLAGGTLNGSLTINGAGGTKRSVAGATAGSNRWRLNLGDDTAEAAFAGSNLTIEAFDNSGVFSYNWLVVNRMMQQTTINSIIWQQTSTTGAQFALQAGAGSSSYPATLLGMKGPTNGARWEINLVDGTQETGANAGSNFTIRRYSDAAAVIDTPITINRANGYVTLANDLILNSSNNLDIDFYRPALKRANIRVLDKTTALLRWTFIMGDESAESGGNAGTNVVIYRHTDAGAANGTVLSISRATGAVSFTVQPTIPGYATLASPTFTGVPAAPTAALNTNTTQIATTAFVQAAVSTGGGNYLALSGGTLTGQLKISMAAGTNRSYLGMTGTYNRWEMAMGNGAAETGSNNGSDFNLSAYDDAGNLLSTPMNIVRATGTVYFNAGMMWVNAKALNNDAVICLNMNGTTQSNSIWGGNNSVLRWALDLGNSVTETGTGNVGTDFTIRSFTDAGASLATPLTIKRSSGLVTFSVLPSLPGGAANNILTTNGAGVLSWGAAVPVASSTAPVMDGVAAIGVGTTWARADHVHASDTSRAPLASPTFTGVPAAPTAAANTNTTQLATTAFVMAAIPAAASNAAPVMDSAAASGAAVTWSRSDHVHPSDTTRVIKAGDTMTGALTLSLAAGLAQSVIGANAGSKRWEMMLGDTSAESTGNLGSHFQLKGTADNGTTPISTLLINRTYGVISSNAPGATVATAVLGFTAGDSSIILNKIATHASSLVGMTNGVLRWTMNLGEETAEAGSNVGSNFSLESYSDAGALLTTVMSISRASGVMTLSAMPSIPGGTNGFVLSTNGSGALSWSALPAIPVASSTTPVMDGVAAVGAGTTWARADHVHPSDTTKANLNSPAFTGTPTLPTGATGITQTAGNNSTALATTAFVVAGFASTGSLAAYAPLASPTFTGTPAAPTASAGTNTTQLATTAFVAAGFGALASPAFTGVPTAPTAAADTNTTQIATTAFVCGQAGLAAPNMDGTASVGISVKFSRGDHVHPTDTSRAPLASPVFTGAPSLPTGAIAVTQAPGDNDTSVATTAFVAAGLALYLPLTGGTTSGNIFVEGGSVMSTLYSDASYPTFVTHRTRGTKAAPTINLVNDNTGSNHYYGYDGVAYRSTVSLQSFVIEPTPSTTAFGGKFSIFVTPLGTNAVSPIASFLGTGLVMTGGLDVTLGRDPTIALHAATKQYVDAVGVLQVTKAGDTMTGALTIAPAAGGFVLYLKPPAGNAQLAIAPVAATGVGDLWAYRNTSARWLMRFCDASETGTGNTGSTFGLYRYDDTGVLLGTSLAINRATGAFAITGATTISGTLATGAVTSTAGVSGTNLSANGPNPTISFRASGTQPVDQKNWDFFQDSTGNLLFRSLNDPYSASFSLITFTRNTGYTAPTVTMGSGLLFGSVLAAGVNDLTKHLSIWGTSYGFCVTSGRLNINGGSLFFVSTTGNDVTSFTSNGSITTSCYSDDVNYSTFAIRNSRGGAQATATAVLANDYAGIISGQAYNGAAFTAVGQFRFKVIEATPSATAMGSQVEVVAMPIGSIAAQVAAIFKYGEFQVTTVAGSASGASLSLQKSASGQGVFINSYTGPVAVAALRWQMVPGNGLAESGSNAGSNFEFRNYSDTGVQIGVPLTLNRANGQAVFSGPLLTLATTGSTSASIVLNKPTSGIWSNIQGQMGGVNRWVVDLGEGTAETGSNTGSNFSIRSFTDAGAGLATPLIIARATGVATFSAAIVNGPSDRRLKENIKPIEDALAKVLKLQGVSFNMIDSLDKRSEIGLIAQDVLPVVPEVIQSYQPGADAEPMLALDYPKLTALLIEAVKTLTERVKELEGKQRG